MHSPKYEIRKKELRQLFRDTDLARIWKEKVRISLKRSILRDPLDNLDFASNSKSECERLAQLVLDGFYQPTAPLRIRVEKSKGLCRLISVPSREDAIVLQRLSDALYLGLKDAAPTKKAFFERESFSFKEKFVEPEYGSFKSWIDFQKELFGFASERPFVIITDIANFYDFVSYAHLRNIVSASILEKESILDMLLFTLTGLIWQPDYMPRIEVGLPQMDLDAPRLLAHCMLYEIDALVNEHPNIDYVRFMDDMDIGVNSVAEAKLIIRDIDQTLQTRQLRLNSGKTKILTKTQAIRHFRTRENFFLDRFQTLLKKKFAAKLSCQKERKFLPAILKRKYDKGEFDDGNGEKILKRLLTIADFLDAPISAKLLLKIIRDRPGVREKALMKLSKQGLSKSSIDFLTYLIRTRHFVCDASFIWLGRYVFQSSITLSIPNKTAGKSFVNAMTASGRFGFVGALYAAPKFLSPKEIYDLILKNRATWKADAKLAGIVAALAPYFFRDPIQFSRFRNLISSQRNPDAERVMYYLEEVRFQQPPKAFIDSMKATNPSEALMANHEKVGMIVAVSYNSSINASQKAKIMKAHKAAVNDPYLKGYFSKNS